MPNINSTLPVQHHSAQEFRAKHPFAQFRGGSSLVQMHTDRFQEHGRLTHFPNSPQRTTHLMQPSSQPLSGLAAKISTPSEIDHAFQVAGFRLDF
jgi:hypothetical protein